MSGLVEGRDLFLVRANHLALARRTGDQTVNGLKHFVLGDLFLVPPRCEDRRLVDQVCKVCAAESRRLLRQRGQVHIISQGFALGVDIKNRGSAADVR